MKAMMKLGSKALDTTKEYGGKAYDATKEYGGKAAHAAQKQYIQSDILHGEISALSLAPAKLPEHAFAGFPDSRSLATAYAEITKQCENARYLGNASALESASFKDAVAKLTDKSITQGGGKHIAEHVKELVSHAKQIAKRTSHCINETNEEFKRGYLDLHTANELQEDFRRVFNAAGVQNAESPEVPARLHAQVTQMRRAWAKKLDDATAVGMHKKAVKAITDQINYADSGDVKEAISQYIELEQLQPQMAKTYLAHLQKAIKGLADRTDRALRQSIADRSYGVTIASRPRLKTKLESNIKLIGNAEDSTLALVAPGTADSLASALREVEDLRPAPDFHDDPFVN